MSNTINYAEKWQSEILEILKNKKVFKG